MNRHLVRMLLTLYPRPWRDRYGTEVVRLTQELIATGETTPTRGALNIGTATGNVTPVVIPVDATGPDGLRPVTFPPT